MARKNKGPTLSAREIDRTAADLERVALDTLAALKRQARPTAPRNVRAQVQAALESLIAERDAEWFEIVASIVRSHAMELQAIHDRLEPGAVAELVQGLLDGTIASLSICRDRHRAETCERLYAV